MSSTGMMLIILIIISHMLIMILGVGLGYLIWGRQMSVYEKPGSFLKSQGKDKQSNSIEIDDTKVVLSVNTDGYEKKFDNMTKETKVKNNISSSVNKLKNMKGK